MKIRSVKSIHKNFNSILTYNEQWENLTLSILETKSDFSLFKHVFFFFLFKYSFEVIKGLLFGKDKHI